MSLEAKLELLTEAINELTAAISAMQAPGPLTEADKEVVKKSAPVQTQRANPAEPVTEAEPKSSDTTSGEPSAPTGESSSPALDYVKDVKPITIQLSKEKGREITIGVLSRFGVKSAQDLEPAQWVEYIAHCKSVLAGGEV